MTELLAQMMTKWSADGVSVWRRSRPQCSRSGNRSATKKDWNFSHRSVGGIWSLHGQPGSRRRRCLLWQHVPSCDRWTWMTELLAQTITKWSADGVPVSRRSRPQCCGSRNRSVTKKYWNFSHRSVGGIWSLHGQPGFRRRRLLLWQHVPSC